MFRQRVQLPTASTAFSTTNTTVMTLTIPANDRKRINITGFAMRYATTPSTGQPYFNLGGGRTFPLIPAGVTANVYNQFHTPISGSFGDPVSLLATSTAGGVMSMYVQYFYSS